MKLPPRTSLIITLLLVSSLIVITIEQRGRGGRSRSSSRSFRSSSFGRSGSSGNKSLNCTTVNGETVCTQKDKSLFDWIVIVIGVIIAVHVIVGFITEVIRGILIPYFNSKDDKKIAQSVLDSFKSKMEQSPSILDESKRSQMIDQFVSRNKKMVITVKNSLQEYHCSLKVEDVKKENDSQYRIKMSGSDEVGACKFDGFLIFTEDQLALKLSKAYSNRNKAGQTYNFRTLLYEGTGTPALIRGQWAFKGYENSSYYSGSWSMSS